MRTWKRPQRHRGDYAEPYLALAIFASPSLTMSYGGRSARLSVCLCLGLTGCLESAFSSRCSKNGNAFSLHPDWEALAPARSISCSDCEFGDGIFLASVHKVRSYRSIVEGEIDIFRKTADRTVNL